MLLLSPSAWGLYQACGVMVIGAGTRTRELCRRGTSSGQKEGSLTTEGQGARPSGEMPERNIESLDRIPPVGTTLTEALHAETDCRWQCES